MFPEGGAATEGATAATALAGESSGGLLAAAREAVEGKAAATATPESVPITSTRPADIPENFWDAAKGVVRAEEMVKSWKNAVADRDRLKQQAQSQADPAPDAPDKYLDAALFKDGKLVLTDKTASWGEITNDDPVLTGFAAACHEIGIGQKAFGALLPKIMEHLAPKLPPPVDIAEEIKALDNGVPGRGQQMIDSVTNWVNRQIGHGELSAEEGEYINDFCRDAFGVRTFAKLVAMNGTQPIPVGPSLDPSKSVSQDEWKAMVRSPQYLSDEGYRNRVNAMGERLFPEAQKSAF